jgi:hypothetical protein
MRSIDQMGGEIAMRPAAVAARQTYVIRLRPRPGIDPIRALRGALKVLGRRFGLRAIEVREERET